MNTIRIRLSQFGEVIKNFDGGVPRMNSEVSQPEERSRSVVWSSGTKRNFNITIIIDHTEPLLSHHYTSCKQLCLKKKKENSKHVASSFHLLLLQKHARDRSRSLDTRRSCSHHFCPHGAPESTKRKVPWSCFKWVVFCSSLVKSCYLKVNFFFAFLSVGRDTVCSYIWHRFSLRVSLWYYVSSPSHAACFLWCMPPQPAAEFPPFSNCFIFFFCHILFYMYLHG